MVAEGLAGMVRQTLRTKVLRGVKVGVNNYECCLLQFADDTLFMCEDSFDNIFAIKAILRCFELASGLKVNFHKSKLAGIRVDSYAMSTYAKTLNCNIMSLPFPYLGVQVGGNPRKKQFWEPVIKKIEARLSSWKGREIPLHGGSDLSTKIGVHCYTFVLPLYLQSPCSSMQQHQEYSKKISLGVGKTK